MKKHINIVNRKARFEYEFIEKYTAGIVLSGTEIKSIRNSKASISESFCEIDEHGNANVVNMNIEPYTHGGYNNHEPKRTRRLLLQKTEIKKLHKKVTTSGLTIVPVKLYINPKGYAKLDIVLAKGKKLYDKRHDIRDRESKIKLDRVKKDYNK